MDYLSDSDLCHQRLDVVPDWIWEIDLDGKFMYSNAVVADLLGYTQEEILGESIFDLLFSEDLKNCREAFINAKEKKQPVKNVSAQLHRADHELRTFAISCVPMWKSETELVGFRGIARDITDKVDIQNIALEALQNYRTALDESPVGIVIIQDEKAVYANPKLREIIGFELESTMGENIWEYIHPDDAERTKEYYRARLSGKESPSEYEIRLITKSGEIKYVEIRVTLIEYKGRPALLDNIIDITERTQTEQALRESEERFKRLVEDVSDWIWEIDENAVYTYASPRIYDLLGYKPEEIIGFTPFNLMRPEEAERVSTIFGEISAKCEPLELLRNTMLHKNGKEVIVETSASPMFDLEGNPCGYRGVDRDITQRVMYENQLKERTEELEAIFHAFPDLYFWIDSNGRILNYHAARPELLYIGPDHFIGKRFSETIPDEVGKRLDELIRQVIEKKSTLSIEYELMISGTPHYFEARLMLLEEDKVLAIIRDITQRKHAEFALAEAEEKYRSLVEKALVGVYIIQDDDLVYINPCAAEFFGYTPDELIGRGKLMDTIAPADRPMVIETLSMRVSGEFKSAHYQFKGIRKDGKEINVEVYGSQTMYMGRPAVIGTLLDVTDRLKAERDLRAERNFANAILDTVGALVTVVTPDGRIIRANQACVELSGYTHEELKERPFWDFLLPPDEIPRLKGMFDNLGSAETPLLNENNWITKDGRLLLISWSNVPIRDENGNVDYLVATGIDITEQRQAEQELQHKILLEEVITTLSTEFINLLPEEIDNGIQRAIGILGEYIGADRSYLYLIDEDGVTARYSYKWFPSREQPSPDELSKSVVLNLNDYPFIKESLRKKESVYIPVVDDLPDEQYRLRDHLISKGIKSAIYLPMMSHGKPIGFLSFEKIHQTGKWSEDNIMPLRVMGEVIVNVLDRKETEEALRYSEERYRLLFERSPNIVMVIRNDRITDINPMVKKMLGYDEEEVLGLAPWDLSSEVQPDGMLSKEKFTMLIEQAQKDGPISFYWLYQGRDGNFVDCDISLTSYYVDGEIHIQAIVRDITERKRAEEHRRMFERQIEEQKKVFYKDTILSVTNGKLDIADSTEIRKYLAKAEFEITVNDASEVAPARRGVEDYCYAKELTGDRLDAFMIGVGEAITNAIKHAKRGRVYAGMADDEIWVATRDRGPGINSLILPRATLLRGFSTKPSMGLGYSIMLEVSDQILLKTDMRGTTVILKKCIKEPDILLTPDILPDTWNTIPS